MFIFADKIQYFIRSEAIRKSGKFFFFNRATTLFHWCRILMRTVQQSPSTTESYFFRVPGWKVQIEVFSRSDDYFGFLFPKSLRTT